MDIMFWVHMAGVVMKIIATTVRNRDEEAEIVTDEE